MGNNGRSADLKRLRTTGGLVAAALFALLASACSRDTSNQPADSTAASSTTAGTTNVPIPAAINDVGTYGEDLYDQAKVEGWTRAKAYLDSLHIAATNLPDDQPVQRQRSALDSAIIALDEAVAARNRAAALEAANRVTYIAAQMATPYRAATPIAVALLDYYGRELEIWASQKNLPKLKETAAALERTWTALRPTVEQSGGATAARDTDRLVARIKAAKSPAGYASIATPFLDQVDELEKVFVKP